MAKCVLTLQVIISFVQYFLLTLVFLIECEEKADEFLLILQFFLTKVLASFYHDVPCVALRKLSHDRIRGCFVSIIAKMYSVFHFKNFPFCKYPVRFRVELVIATIGTS